MKVYRWFVIATVLCLALVSCVSAPKPSEQSVSPASATASSQPTSPPESKGGGRLEVALSREPELQSLDVNTTYGISTAMVAGTIYASLFEEDEQKNLHPGLATSYEFSPDGRQLTLQLRKNVTFHDGTPFNADSVKFTFDRSSAPDNAAALSKTYLGPDYLATEVVDEYSVKLTFREPYPVILHRLTSCYLAPVSPSAVERLGDQFKRNPVGAGPFMFKEWVANDHITVVRNPDFSWASQAFKHQGLAYLDEINFVFIPEGSARLAALESGQVHVIEQVLLSEAERIGEDERFQLLQWEITPIGWVMYLNTERAPTNALEVRQAIALAINRQEIVDTAQFGVPTVGENVITPNTYGYDKSVEGTYSYDPARADALLDGAGWVRGSDGIRAKDGQPLQVYFPIAREKETAEIIQVQLKQVGIQVDIEMMSAGALRTIETKGGHNFTQNWAVGEDPIDLTRIFLSSYIDAQFAPTRYRDQRLDELLVRQGQLERGPERLEVLSEIQHIIVGQAILVPLFNTKAVWGAMSNVEGIWPGMGNYAPELYDAHFRQ